MVYTWICILAATIVLNTLFVVTLLSSLTWDQRGMFLFALAALMGGLFFTIRTLQRANKLN